MASFATEFPVRPIADSGVFVAQIIEWLRGIRSSSIADEPSCLDFNGDAKHVKSKNGEELLLRALCSEGKLEAIGCRHDLPDSDGRLWRTDVVLRKPAMTGGNDLVRIRTECIALMTGARLDFPRKPFLIKSMLTNGWGTEDGVLTVGDEPIWLKNDDAALQIAAAITKGKATEHLPVVYVSANGTGTWLGSTDQIEKLAYDLGGVAHVVVEPDRTFSYKLRSLTDGGNVYGGTLGLAIPDRGIVRRFFQGLRLSDAPDLFADVHKTALRVQSQMPADGLDWTELQEQALHREQERARGLDDAKEMEKLYVEEIKNLHDRIRQQNEQIKALEREAEEVADVGLLPAIIARKLGPEIYPGEFLDRLRLAAKDSLGRADQSGLDKRSRAFFGTFVVTVQPSPGLRELEDDLDRVTRDSRRAADAITTLLTRHGYQQKSDNKHLRLEAKDSFAGLEALTLAKTPSDTRALKNMKAQIIRALGILKLSE